MQYLLARGAGCGLSLVRSARCTTPGLLGSLLPVAGPGRDSARLTAARGYYFPRKNWFPWRSRLIHEHRLRRYQRRNIYPRKSDPNEAPVRYPKEDGKQLAFREKEVRIGMKRMLEYCRLIRHKQLQDAVDWVESISRMKSAPILKLLNKVKKDCVEKYKMDPARIYIFEANPFRGTFVKSIRMHTRGKYGIQKSPRHIFMVRVREMPLEEYFHRLYIVGKTPKSLGADMRMALREGQVSPQMMKEWQPYLCAASRYQHRRDLKYLDKTRQFDYYEVRRDWIQAYQANLLRASTEAREARGLPPIAVE